MLTVSRSYCNSIIQCLYYSSPFREQVINFPKRSAPDAVRNILAERAQPAQDQAQAPAVKKGLLGTSTASPAQKGKPGAPAAGTGPQGPKAEDNKDSPEYKKKMAMAAGPVLTMDYENSNAYGMPESLFTSLKDIFEAVIAHQSRMGVVSPQKFLEILRRENEMFRTPMHQDAHEFLNLLLNDVVENVEKYSKGAGVNGQKLINEDASDMASSIGDALTPIIRSSVPEPGLKLNGHTSKWVHDLFEGTLTSETRCLTCENTSQRDEAFLDLSVDLEQHASVTACLRKFSEEEMLCERNKFHCDKCGGLQEAEKRMKIKRLPRILALHLKRFKYTEDLQRLQKLFHRVNYPYFLRLFNTTDDAEDSDRLYELYAVVVHIGGGPYHGHYVCIIKTTDQGWLLFDDELVEPVDKSYVQNFFGGEGNLACAYVLFYQETTMEAMQAELDAEGLSAAKNTAPVNEIPSSPVKANGTINGTIHGHSIPATPMLSDLDQFATLDRATTLPLSSAMPSTPIPFQPPPLEPVATSPSAMPFLNRKKSDVFAKKEAERVAKEQDKQRKIEEKEAEKKKRKEVEQQRRDYQKKQEEEMKAVSTTTRPDGLKRVMSQNDKLTSALQDTPPPTKENGSSGSSSFGLHRFRATSKSLRHKPKLFGSQKEKDRGKGKDNSSADEAVGSDPSDVAPPVLPTSAPSEPASLAGGTGVVLNSLERKQSQGQTKEKEKDRERFRFGLNRKKSHAGLIG